MIKKQLLLAFLALGLANAQEDEKENWIQLFNGKDLTGWKVNSENPKSVRAEDGILIIDGERTHAFYAGPVGNHDFKNFEFKAKVKTFPKANSGIYFHTKFQDSGWPSIGYEAQVNNTHKDPKKTGGLYAVQDNINHEKGRHDALKAFYFDFLGCAIDPRKYENYVAGKKVS